MCIKEQKKEYLNRHRIPEKNEKINIQTPRDFSAVTENNSKQTKNVVNFCEK